MHNTSWYGFIFVSLSINQQNQQLQPLSLAFNFNFSHATDLKHRTKVSNRQEQSQVTKEEYGFAVQLGRDALRKVKTLQELNLARNMKGNREVFYKYKKRKRKMSAQCWMAQESWWQLTYRRMRWLMPSFSQSLPIKSAIRNPRPLRTERIGARKTDLVMMGWAREQISSIYKLKSAEADVMSLWGHFQLSLNGHDDQSNKRFPRTKSDDITKRSPRAIKDTSVFWEDW